MDAEEMAKLLNQIMAAYGKDEKKDFQLVAIKPLNRIIAISGDQTLLSKLEGLVSEFDRPDETVEPRIYVYFVKNGKADELGGILTSIFSAKADTGKNKKGLEKTEKPGDSKPRLPTSPFQTGGVTRPEIPATGVPGEPLQGSGTLRGQLKITSDPIRNALIIEAIPSDYRIVEDILNQLDVLSRQVLIEVVIAELTFNTKDELGVDWAYLDGEGSLTADILSASMGSAGLQFLVGQTGRWAAELKALATENRANILSAPLVLASDNKEARIDISDQIPVASAEYVYTGDNPLTQTTIQYRDTGIILSVTPHISERGLVSMDISQEVSEQGAGTTVGGQEYPSFQQRKVVTSLTVSHGQTIVMGGLMREKEENTSSGVPFLSAIPVIGSLFGKDTKERVKVDLMLFITPRVIVNLADVDTVTKEFKNKINNLMFLKERAGHS